MEITTGLRVVRGPGWKWGDQDGGEGWVGTVVEVQLSEVPVGARTMAAAVVVQWDNGNRCNYRCGVEDQYDLRVLDSAPTGMMHQNVVCDACRQNNIAGLRWKCSNCMDFDLCTQCYNLSKHSLDHIFIRIDGEQRLSTQLPPRKSSKRLTAKGLFPDAKVLRGHDWLWGDQDGGVGSHGILLDIRGWEGDASRSVGNVEWMKTGKKNVYRIGHKGKVDLKCERPGSGNGYYPDHLPVLGEPYKPPPTPSASSSSSPSSSTGFVAGDRIRVQLEPDIFRLMQDGHGGWSDEMAEQVMTEVGTIQSVLASGDIRVSFVGSHVWTLNSGAVVKVDGKTAEQTGGDRGQQPQFQPVNDRREQVAIGPCEGDVVRVSDDIALVHSMQEGHGGWVDDMALALGQLGKVLKVFPTGDVRVSVNSRTWTFHPVCMALAPEETLPDVPPPPEVDSDDISLQLKVLSLLENPAVIVAAAAGGDITTLKDYLTSHPGDVDARASGKAAIHCAAVAGHIPILQVLVEFKANLELEDEDGDKPLHLCAYGDEDEATTLLLEHGALVNSKNHKGATPLIIAAAKGHHSVLRILIGHQDIDLHEQDSDGDTALHCAVLAQKHESVSILLDAKSDPTRLNFRLFTPIHEAARIGFLPAVEQFNRRFPHHVNLKKDDGYMSIHLASLNDHLDVVTALIEMESCEIDGRTNGGQTALLLAVAQGHSRIVERLVGFGALVYAQDSDGDSPLHMALERDSVDTLSDDTPQLRKVQSEFAIEGNSPSHASVTMACFLVQEGADLYMQNKKGLSPLQLCSADVAALLTSCFAQKKHGSFHGSLRSPTGLDDAAAVPARQKSLTSFPTTVVPTHTVVTPTVQAREKLPSAPPRTNMGHPTKTNEGKESMKPVISVTSDTCFLCDNNPVNVRFTPCGHAVMCSECAKRARKCPICQLPIEGTEALDLKCAMCSDEEATVTMRPCGHKFCAGCCRRLKKCYHCRAEIEEKEGLPPEEPPPPPITISATSKPPAESSPCPICLTEPRDTVFLCGHQLCYECASKVDHCPVCRKFVTHRIKLFD